MNMVVGQCNCKLGDMLGFRGSSIHLMFDLYSEFMFCALIWSICYWELCEKYMNESIGRMRFSDHHQVYHHLLVSCWRAWIYHPGTRMGFVLMLTYERICFCIKSQNLLLHFKCHNGCGGIRRILKNNSGPCNSISWLGHIHVGVKLS